ncbi:MAG TPA: hypothetical protein VHB27_16960, partial [Rhodopila sp.]|uniref:hypothetical protein n=1 Tax=Rhodopila sp. TaxID=2480087 RepID=UPI002C2CD8BF
PQVLGENQAVMASDLKRNLQGSLASLRAGIEVLGIIIETIHPPAGAAPAYRNVQAAEVQAATEIASEKGRAEATLSTAKMQAETRRNEATGAAAQIESGARVDLTNMQADDGPYRAAPAPFMMERYFAALKAVLPGVPLAIVDNPLGGGLSTIDLRPPGSDRLSTGIGREP